VLLVCQIVNHLKETRLVMKAVLLDAVCLILPLVNVPPLRDETSLQIQELFGYYRLKYKDPPLDLVAFGPPRRSYSLRPISTRFDCSSLCD